MDEKNEKTEKDSCCESSGSCGCGAHRCCAGKAAFVLVLLLIGGLIGYSMGRCHSYRASCMMPFGHPMMGDVQAPASK